eukprot:gene2733-biopygen11640
MSGAHTMIYRGGTKQKLGHQEGDVLRVECDECDTRIDKDSFTIVVECSFQSQSIVGFDLFRKEENHLARDDSLGPPGSTMRSKDTLPLIWKFRVTNAFSMVMVEGGDHLV